MERIKNIDDLNMITGISNDYFFVVKPAEKKHRYSIEFAVSYLESGTILKFIGMMSDTDFKGKVLKGAMFTGVSLKLTINTKKMNLNSDLGEVVDLITAQLREQGYTQMCQSTKATTELGLYRVGNNVLVLNREAYYELSTKEIAQQEKKGNPILGYVGALVGILLGGVVWLVVGMTGYIVGIVGFLIVFLGYKGYELMAGKPTKLAAIIIFLASLVMVVLAEYTSIALVLHNDYFSSYGFNFWETLTQVTPIMFDQVDFMSVFLRNVAMGLLFTVAAGFGLMKDTFKSAGKEAITEAIFPFVEQQAVEIM